MLSPVKLPSFASGVSSNNFVRNVWEATHFSFKERPFSYPIILSLCFMNRVALKKKMNKRKSNFTSSRIYVEFFVHLYYQVCLSPFTTIKVSNLTVVMGHVPLNL